MDDTELEATGKVIDVMGDLQRALAKSAGSGRARKPGRREPWTCPHCGDVVHCRKADCVEKTEAARARMGLGGAK